MMRIFFILLLVMLSLNAKAKSVRIGIFSGNAFSRFAFMIINGEYSVSSNESQLFRISKKDSLVVCDSSGWVTVILNGKRNAVALSLNIKPTSDLATIRVEPVSKPKSGLSFRGEVQVISSGQVLKLVNTIDLEAYVAGVVESEIGREVYPEMVKVQAILARTYAMSNLNRHAAEGFSLCDKVHCQVYCGTQKYHAGIRKPVLSTRDLVLADAAGQLAVTVYHSNCGGKTAEASDVWSGDISTLRSVTDSFCQNKVHSQWQKKLSRKEWDAYLTLCGIRDSQKVNMQLRDAYTTCTRTCCLEVDSIRLPLKNIRKEFNLKSSFFCVTSTTDSVCIVGKGYGHGVGLCQEGANVMAQRGYPADSILKYYYKDVKVLRLSEVRFPVN